MENEFMLHRRRKFDMMKRFKIEVSNPCNLDWDKSSKTDKGVYCVACSKEVVDFTKLSDKEINHFFLNLKDNEKICGRLNNCQLDKTYETSANRSQSSSLFRILAFVLGISGLYTTQNLYGQVKKINPKITSYRSKPLKKTIIKQPINAVTEPDSILIFGHALNPMGGKLDVELKGTTYKTISTWRGDFYLYVCKDVLKANPILHISNEHIITKEIYVDSCNGNLGEIKLEAIKLKPQITIAGGLGFRRVEKKQSLIAKLRRFLIGG